MDVKPSCLNSQRAALSGNMQMMQPFLLDRINLWGYSYPLGGLRVQCRWHSQRLGCRLLLPMGRGKSQWLGGIQWRMCGLPSSTWQFLWGRWFGLRLCASCPPSATLDLCRAFETAKICSEHSWCQCGAQGGGGERSGPTSDKRQPFDRGTSAHRQGGWDHQAFRFQINVGLEPFRAFCLVHFFPLIFSLYLGVLVARTVFM